jgi:distribution and morphology protein 12
MYVPIKVEELDFGTEPPEVCITHLCDPWPEFYRFSDSEDGQSSSSSFWEQDSVRVEDSVSVVNQSPSLASHPRANETQTEETLRRREDEPSVAEDQVQIEMDIKYEGNLRLTLSTELIVNHPTPHFLILPIRMTLTKFHLKGLVFIVFFEDGWTRMAHYGRAKKGPS